MWTSHGPSTRNWEEEYILLPGKRPPQMTGRRDEIVEFKKDATDVTSTGCKIVGVLIGIFLLVAFSIFTIMLVPFADCRWSGLLDLEKDDRKPRRRREGEDSSRRRRTGRSLAVGIGVHALQELQRQRHHRQSAGARIGHVGQRDEQKRRTGILSSKKCTCCIPPE